MCHSTAKWQPSSRRAASQRLHVSSCCSPTFSAASSGWASASLLRCCCSRSFSLLVNLCCSSYAFVCARYVALARKPRLCVLSGLDSKEAPSKKTSCQHTAICFAFVFSVSWRVVRFLFVDHMLNSYRVALFVLTSTLPGANIAAGSPRAAYPSHRRSYSRNILAMG